MGEPTLESADLRAVLLAVATDMETHIEELRELDAALGDGDLGITMQLAAGAIAEAGKDGQEDDVGVMLSALALSINKVSPSTFGTLLASAFLGAATPVRGRHQVGARELAAMGTGAVEGVTKRGKAKVGDKTMLDALVPAVEAFQTEVESGQSVSQALEKAVVAAAEGVEATTSMTAKFGRASWHGEESVGKRDAGAVAVYHLIDSFAAHAQQRLQ